MKPDRAPKLPADARVVQGFWPQGPAPKKRAASHAGKRPKATQLSLPLPRVTK